MDRLYEIFTSNLFSVFMKRYKSINKTRLKIIIQNYTSNKNTEFKISDSYYYCVERNFKSI